MKIFNKVLALVLALITVLTVLPLSVFAKAWADVNTESTGDGTKVTITLDAKTLAEILQRDGISKNLLQSLKEGASVDVAALREAFSVQDLFDIIPREDWLKVFDIEEIANQLGLETLLDYIDTEGLIKEVLDDDAALAKLEALLADVDGLDKCFDALTLLQKGYIVSKTAGQTQEDLILSCISEENRIALVNAIKNDPDKLDMLITYLEQAVNGDGFDLAALKKLLDVEQIVEDGVISISAVVDTDKVQALIDDNKITIGEIVDTDKVQDLINDGKLQISQVVDTDKVQDLINDGKLQISQVVDTDKVQDLINDGKLQISQVVDTDKVQGLINDGKLQISQVVDTAKVQDLINDGKLQISQVVDTSKVQTLINDGKLQISQVVDNAKVLDLINDGKINISKIVDNNKVKTLITDGKIVADTVVKMDVAAEKLQTVISGASGNALVSELEPLVNVTNLQLYLTENRDPADLVGYVDVDGSGNITVTDKTGLIQDRKITVQELLNNNNSYNLIDETALAEVAIDYVDINEIVDSNAVKELINDSNSQVKIDDVIDHAAVKALINDTNSGVKIDDVINKETVKGIINDPNSGVKIDDVIDKETVKAIINDPNSGVKIDDVIDKESVKAIINDPNSQVKIDDVIDKESVKAIINDPNSQVKIDDVIDKEAVKAIINDPNSQVKIDDVIDKEAVKAIINDPNSQVKIDDVIDKEAVKAIINDPNSQVKIDDVIDKEAVQAIIDDPQREIDVDDVIDIDAAKSALLALDNDVLMGYVDTAEAFRLLMTVCDMETLVTDLIGGYDVAMTYIDIPALINGIDLIATINNIPSEVLSEVVYFDVLLSKLSISDVLEIVEPQKILDHLKDNAIVDLAREIAQSVDLKGMAVDVAALVANKVLSNVDLLKINGYTVAAERASDELLEIYSDQLVKAIQDLIPDLNDIATLEDNKIFTASVELGYTVDGTNEYKSKKIDFEFVLAGNLDSVRDAATSLKNLLNNYINTDTFEVTPESVVIDLTLPVEMTAVYAEILDLDALTPELREKVMTMTTASANGMIDLLNEQFTFEDVVAILDAIEPSSLYERFKAEGILRVCLEKLGAKMGTDYSAKDLDEMVQFILDKASDQTIESVCAAIEARTGRNVMAYLETLSVKADGYVDKAEEIGAINTLLAAVEGKFDIDVSDISVEEILNRGKDVPVIEKVAEVVARKVGQNALDILNTYSLDELYDRAVQKATEYQEKYVKVKDYLALAISKLPVELQNAKFVDVYEKNGVFAKAGDFTYNPKAIIEKAIDKVFSKVDVPAAEKVVDLFVSRLTGNSVTMNVDISVTAESIRKITFVTRDKETVLLTAFLPIGTDLNVYKNNSALAGYEFTGWATADGVELETMPAEDVTVYADLHMHEVIFTDENNNVLGHFMVRDGATLADYADRLAEIEKLVDVSQTNNSYVYGSNKINWYMGTERVDVTATKITRDTVLKLNLTPIFFLGFEGADFPYEVTEKDGVYTMTVRGAFPEYFTLPFVRTYDPYSDILTRAISDSRVRLDIEIKNDTENFVFIAIENETLVYLANNTQSKASFDYQTDDMEDTAFNEAYGNATGVATYDFSIIIDDTLSSAFGTAPIAIQVPFTEVANTKTHVYTFDANGVREKVDSKVTGDGKYVTFYAKHFSEFMVATEYSITYTLWEAGKQIGNQIMEYYPVGANVQFAFAVPAGFVVVENGIAYGDKTYNYGDTFTMVDENIAMNVTLKGRTYYIYYYVDGVLNEEMTKSYTAVDIPSLQASLQEALPQDVADLAPNGYLKSGKWAGFTTELGVKDLYFFAEWDLISYTIKFVANGEIVSTLDDITVENYESKYVVPAVPAVANKVGSWDVANKTIGNDYVVTINAAYVDMTYAIIADQNVTVSANTATPGTSITVTAKDKVGHTATVTAKDANGETVTITDGAFIMPASTVYVSVTYTPKNFNYTINGVAGEPKPYGSTVEFFFNVKNGEYLASISNICTLVSTTVDANGTKTLTCAFVLTEDTAITYEIKTSAFLTMKLFNGALFTGSGDPARTVENVKFAGWSEAVANALSFATFTLTREPASLLWLWILLVILVLIALIVLIYVLHITGKIGVNFLTRFVVWLVGLFFSLCLAVAALGLKIAGLFGYSEDPDDYGFTEVNADEESVDEKETAEETAAESVEESAEEVAEDLTAEAVIAAEVAEEVVEESVAEEVAEEVTEAVTAEEAPAEETATEEVAEEVAAEETPVEETATEEVTEEVAAEETPAEETATEEVAEEVAEEETPVEETATEEVTEEVTAEETPAEETATEEVTEEVTAEETPAEETATEEVAEEVAAEETPVEETATEEVAEEVAAEEAPVEETATEEVVEEIVETDESEDETKNNK